MVIHLDPVSLKEYYSNVEYLSFHLCSQDRPEQRESFEKIRRDIALAHGFADLKAFNTSFKETFRKSPTEYRKRLNLENRSNDPLFKKK